MGFLNKILGNNGNLEDFLKRDAVVVDVRSPGEFAGGHKPGSINIPLDSFSGELEQIRSFNKPVILCCASGMRSSRALSILKNNGFSDAMNAGSWNSLL